MNLNNDLLEKEAEELNISSFDLLSKRSGSVLSEEHLKRTSGGLTGTTDNAKGDADDTDLSNSDKDLAY